MEKIELIVPETEDGTRLDVFLSKNTDMSRSAASNLVNDGMVLVGGVRKKPSFRLEASMCIEVMQKEESPEEISGCEVLLNVIYDDDSIAVIDKQPGLVVHPGAGNKGGTMVDALLGMYPQIASVGEADRPGIVHRLDKLTSGVMVVAKTQAAYESLKDAFKVHEHLRQYMAICYGRMDGDEGCIKTFMGRNPRDRKKMSSRVTSGREAVTCWKVVTCWRQISLLELTLKTGRTHQIRVHLSDSGHPVVGDPVYGGKKRPKTIDDAVVRARVMKLDRQMLHAFKLGITHPATGEWMEFESALPRDMISFIELLDQRS